MRAFAVALLPLLGLSPTSAGAGPTAGEPAVTERVEVTATRLPEDPAQVPASITVVSGWDLLARGATDLRSALALVAGVDIAPGGDGGPASSVPALWGLREFDAFLLVVDGVPHGGAFNPALATVDLSEVERIEVLRGPAPVFYGATAFVGVIHVIRTGAGDSKRSLSLAAEGRGGDTLAYSTPLPAVGKLRSSVAGGVSRERFRDDRTSADRGHASWRAVWPLEQGSLRFGLDGIWLQQDPASPHPREGPELSSAVPLDANHNPLGAHLNESRVTGSSGYDRNAWGGEWSTTFAVSRSIQSALRGFLTAVSNQSPNAVGLRQSIHYTDVYLDTHLVHPCGSRARLIAGVDHLEGRANARGGDFDYFVALDGSNPPAAPSPDTDVTIRDSRAFSGLYANLEWTPHPELRIDVGGRLNRTAEGRRTASVDLASGARTSGSDRRGVLRGGGSLGLVWTAWRRESDAVRLFTAYRDTFKPAAIDFGLDSEIEILRPETARSYEAGVKTSLAGGAVAAELTGFVMDFENLVVTRSAGGVPGLVNAGAERFRGLELSASWAPRPELSTTVSYSLHDDRFRDFVTEFDGVPTQLRGKRLEMSPRELAAAGVVYAPGAGWRSWAQASWVGSRFLNKRNTALAPDYVSWSGGVGYAFRRWELRFEGRNLNDQRPPVSESELGDAQYYRLPARSIRIAAAWRPG